MISKTLLTMAAFSALSVSTASASDPAGERTFGDWKVACAANAPCQAYLGLKDAKTGKLALSASAHKRPDDANPTLVITVPLGVDLKAGAAFVAGAAGKTPIAATIDVCFPDGCRVVLDLAPSTLNSLAAAKSFDVRFAAYGAADRVESVSVPSNGLKDAIAYLSAKKK